MKREITFTLDGETPVPPCLEGMAITERRLYQFAELSDTAKARAVNDFRDNPENFSDMFFADYDSKMGFSVAEIEAMPTELRAKVIAANYSIFYNDNELGAFDLERGEYIQFKDLRISDLAFFWEWLGLGAISRDNCTYSILNPSREGSTRLEIEPDFEDGRDFTPEEQALVESAIEKFADKVRDALHGLRASYEAQFEDEYIIETIDANGWEFTSEGELL